MPTKNSILYSTFRPWIQLGSKVFFRKITLAHAENIPKNKPVILIANHQNAMLDPVMLCWMLPKQLHWLTRADLFKKPFVNKLLRSINMLPVYRERDKVADLKGVNNETFDECNLRLKNNQLMCMFPEGTHRGKKQLVPLKKGVARIAINAVESGLDDLCILPVGLNYESFYNYRTSLLAKVGQPISVKDIIAPYSNPAQAQNALLVAVRDALKTVMIDIEHEDVYEEILDLEPLCNKLSGSTRLVDQFDYYHRTVQSINTDTATHAPLKAIAQPYLQLHNELQIEEKHYSEKGFSAIQYLMLFLGALPSLLAGIILYPIYALAEKLVQKIVKDPLFLNSIRICVWTFITPFYLLLLLLIFSFFNVIDLSFLTLFLCLVCSSAIALYWWPLYRQYKQHRLCNKYLKNNDSRFHQWIKAREELKNWILQLNLNKQYV